MRKTRPPARRLGRGRGGIIIGAPLCFPKGTVKAHAALPFIYSRSSHGVCVSAAYARVASAPGPPFRLGRRRAVGLKSKTTHSVDGSSLIVDRRLL